MDTQTERVKAIKTAQEANDISMSNRTMLNLAYSWWREIEKAIEKGLTKVSIFTEFNCEKDRLAIEGAISWFRSLGYGVTGFNTVIISWYR